MLRLKFHTLWVLVFVIPLNGWITFSSSYLSLVFLASYAYLLLCLADAAKSLHLRKVASHVWPLLLLLILIAATTAYHFDDRSEQWASTLRLLFFYAAVFVMMVNDLKRCPQRIEGIIQAFVFGVMALSLIFLVESPTLIGVGSRMTAGGLPLNTSGQFAAYALLFIMDFVLRRRVTGVLRTIMLLSVPGLLMMLAYSGSRGAILSLFLGALLYFALLRQFTIGQIPLLIGGVLVMGFAFFWIVQLEVVAERFFQSGDLSGYRLTLWSAAVQAIREQPLFGWGVAGFEIKMQQYLGVYRPVHNDFLAIAVYSGLVGSALFLLFLRTVWRPALACLVLQRHPMPLVIFAVLMLYLARSGGGLLSMATWFLLAYLAVCAVPAPASGTRRGAAPEPRGHKRWPEPIT